MRLVTIKKAAELTNLTIKAIRHYESVGLCSPTTFTDSGYRLYSSETLARLREIKYYRDLNFSIHDISTLLDADRDTIRNALETHKITIEQQLTQLNRAKATLESALSVSDTKHIKGGVAIITIDLQNDILEGGALPCPRIHYILPKINNLFQKARKENIPIIYICDNHSIGDEELLLWNDHMMEGTWGSQIIDEVAPSPEDIIVRKNRFNGFINNDLQQRLDSLQIHTLIFTGWRTDVCVAQTAIEAFYRGFHVVIAEDGVNSTSENEHKTGLSMMQINYGFKCYPCETILENILAMK